MLQHEPCTLHLEVHFTRVIQHETRESELSRQAVNEGTKAHALHQSGNDERTSLEIAGWHCRSVHERDDVALPRIYWTRGKLTLSSASSAL